MENANLDFCVQPSNSRSVKRVHPLSRHIDPMVFPIIFPFGESGWTCGLKQKCGNPNQDTSAPIVQNIPNTSTTNDTNISNTSTAIEPNIPNITPLKFYAFRIAVRQNIFNPLHYAGKLYQQYLVHAYARTEANNLNYLRKSQSKLRIESYQGLMDHLNTVANSNAATIGIWELIYIAIVLSWRTALYGKALPR